MKLVIVMLALVALSVPSLCHSPATTIPPVIHSTGDTHAAEWFNRPADQQGQGVITVIRYQLYSPTPEEGVPCPQEFNVLLTADGWTVDQKIDIYLVSDKPQQRQYIGPVWIYQFGNRNTGLMTCNAQPSHEAYLVAIGSESGMTFTTPKFDLPMQIGDVQPYPLEPGYTANTPIYNNPQIPRGGQDGVYGVPPFSLYNSRGGRPLAD